MDPLEGGSGGAVGYGTVLDHFAESEELLSLVAALPHVYEELRSREKSEERFTSESGHYHLLGLCWCYQPCRYSG